MVSQILSPNSTPYPDSFAMVIPPTIQSSVGGSQTMALSDESELWINK